MERLDRGDGFEGGFRARGMSQLDSGDDGSDAFVVLSD